MIASVLLSLHASRPRSGFPKGLVAGTLRDRCLTRVGTGCLSSAPALGTEDPCTAGMCFFRYSTVSCADRTCTKLACGVLRLEGSEGAGVLGSPRLGVCGLAVLGNPTIERGCSGGGEGRLWAVGWISG